MTDSGISRGSRSRCSISSGGGRDGGLISRTRYWARFWLPATTLRGRRTDADVPQRARQLRSVDGREGHASWNAAGATRAQLDPYCSTS